VLGHGLDQVGVSKPRSSSRLISRNRRIQPAPWPGRRLDPAARQQLLHCTGALTNTAIRSRAQPAPQRDLPTKAPFLPARKGVGSEHWAITLGID